MALKHVFPDVPVSGGAFRPCSFAIQRGSILSAEYPAAVGGTTDVAPRLVDVVFGALAQAIPERTPAAMFGTTGVATVSIWMGILLTDKLRSAFDGQPEALERFAEQAETPEFTGLLIDALFADPALTELSGQTVIGAELAERYGITDAGGRTPPSHRDVLGAPRAPNTVVVR